jgi:hypothetical protein
MTQTDMRATPDSFVVIVAAPWGANAASLLVQTYEQTWVEPVKISFEGSQEIGALTCGGISVSCIIEEPIPELVELCGSSYEPYAASEEVMLEMHTHVWRLVATGGMEASIALLKIMTAFIEAGGSGIFLPQALRLHSPRTIRVLSMEPDSEQALANIFVNAWHSGDWMRTRGLTAFGLPEIETPVADGLNGAYFRLMDIAANMIRRGGKFPSGSQIMAGPRTFKLEAGPIGPADDRVPMAGHFGVQALVP